MSRTSKGSKKPGFDFWTARPGNASKCAGHGTVPKKRTHRLERLQAKKAERDHE